MGVSSKYMSKLGKEHWIVVKRVFKYLCGTIDHVIYYQGGAMPYKVLDISGLDICSARV